MMDIHLFDFHNTPPKDILISFKGPFEKDLIGPLGEKVRCLTEKTPKASKKIFSVFIELAQNVSYYSYERNNMFEEKSVGVGTLVIGENDDSYLFGTGNMIDNKSLDVLLKKCEIINSLEHEDLREYKRKQRNLIPGTNGGAHIGLIMTALITKRKLDVKVTKVDELSSFFSIVVTITKADDIGIID